MDDMTRREREHEEQYAWWLTQTNNRQGLKEGDRQ